MRLVWDPCICTHAGVAWNISINVFLFFSLQACIVLTSPKSTVKSPTLYQAAPQAWRSEGSKCKSPPRNAGLNMRSTIAIEYKCSLTSPLTDHSNIITIIFCHALLINFPCDGYAMLDILLIMTIFKFVLHYCTCILTSSCSHTILLLLTNYHNNTLPL